MAQLVRFVVRNKVVMVSLDQVAAAKLLPAAGEFVVFQADDFVEGAQAGRSATVGDGRPERGHIHHIARTRGRPPRTTPGKPA